MLLADYTCLMLSLRRKIRLRAVHSKLSHIWAVRSQRFQSPEDAPPGGPFESHCSKVLG